jgi:hypothetical protein
MTTGYTVHFLLGGVLGLLVGLLLLGWRRTARIALNDQLVALVAMLSGVLVGVAWELLEFVADWVWRLDLQLSNADTILELLWHDVGVVLGVLLGGWVWAHALSRQQRGAVGRRGAWLLAGSSRIVTDHARVSLALAVIVAAGATAALWMANRAPVNWPR